MRVLATRLACCALAIILGVAVASAQTRVRVVRRSAIWTPTFFNVATYADEGTELEVVGHRYNWYEVIIPDDDRRARGFIAEVNVEPVGAGAGEPRSQPTPPRSSSGAAAVSRAGGRQSGVRGFGHIGYGSFIATQSFEAILGEAPGHLRGPWYGGGGQFLSANGTFAEASIARFRQTGERVFVFDGTAFRLGIPDTITVMPLTLTLGYRFPGRRAAPFVGGGIGQYFFSEATPFDDDAEKVKERATSYHAVGGVEWSLTGGLAAAVQAQYTRVPDSLSGGAAAAFNEKDLGGLQLAVKVLIGR